MSHDVDKLIDSMNGFKVKTKKIISESLKPVNFDEENESNLLNENNLLKEL
jgi:hypothetical protein